MAYKLSATPHAQHSNKKREDQNSRVMLARMESNGCSQVESEWEREEEN